MDNKTSLIKYTDPNQKGKRTKFQRLVNYLAELKDNEFTGYIKINYTEGNIGRTEKFEEILKQK